MNHPHMPAACSVAPCPSCEPQTPVRNHFFFGKLMDVPDFDVEQAYVVEKFKRHHARLHGTGVICGLEVLAHANPACRDRYLVVKPGAALDCCGNEILLIEEEVLDISCFPAVEQLFEQPDDKDHLLSLCVRYRECPTEEVPVLYDECGCDDTRCEPNRILETYEFDIVVDPTLPTTPPGVAQAPTLTWLATVTLQAAKALALHAASNRAYLAADLSGGASGTVQQYWLSTQAFIASHNFATTVSGIAANGDGTRLVAAVAGAAAGNPTRLALLDTSGSAPFAGAELSTLDLAATDAPGSVRLMSLAVDRFAALVVKGGDTQLFVVQISGGNTLAQVATATINGFEAVGWALGSDADTLYLAQATGAMQSVDVSGAVLTPVALGLSGSDVSGVAIVSSSAPDVIAWTEKTAKQIKLAKPDGTPIHQNTLPEPPVALVIDPVGQFGYVLLQPATGASEVVAVDLHRMLAQKPALFSNTLGIGPGGSTLALTDERLWVVYADGAAIVKIEQTHCADFLDPHGCPGCATPDCVVLATIPNYRAKRSMQDPTVPPSDPLADAAADIARIDMLTWRVTVPSVADLALAVRCMLEHCCAGNDGTGTQGPRGDPGTVTPGDKGDKGDPGGPGLDWDLPHICDISWPHGKDGPFRQVFEQGLIVGFDTPVLGRDLHVDSIHVQAQRPDERLGDMILCWCDLNLNDNIEPGWLSKECDIRSFVPGLDPQGMATGLLIRLPMLERVMRITKDKLKLRVLINGDFIRGIHHKTGELRALDADHIPKVDPPSPPGPAQPGTTPQWIEGGDGRFSGDGIEGGTFESWFTVQQG